MATNNQVVLHTDLNPEECMRRIKESTVPRPTWLQQIFYGRYIKRWGKDSILLNKFTSDRFTLRLLKEPSTVISLQGKLAPDEQAGSSVECRIRKPSVISMLIMVLAVVALIALVPDKTTGEILFTDNSPAAVHERIHAICLFGGFMFLLFVFQWLYHYKEPAKLLNFVKATLDASEQ